MTHSEIANKAKKMAHESKIRIKERAILANLSYLAVDDN